jgi:hypothetical protein
LTFLFRLPLCASNPGFIAAAYVGFLWESARDPAVIDPMHAPLKAALSLFSCLRDEFCAFNVEVMAYAIHGAISEYVANTSLIHKIDPETYGSELVRLFDRSVLRETHE